MDSGPTDKITSWGSVKAFISGRACSDTLLHVISRSYGLAGLDEERAASLFAGGLIRHGYQCGMIWGSTLAAGAEIHRRFGAGPEAEARAIVAAGKIFRAFRGHTTHVDCLEITGLDEKSTFLKTFAYFLLKGGTIGCIRMAARFAPIAHAAIEEALEEAVTAPPEPVSCAALTARKLGAAPQHAVMAAGMAGGIGLGGGACGALGTAVWLAGLRESTKRKDKFEFKNKEAMAAIDRFLKASDYRFECSMIAGRLFNDPADHAAYLRDGGCREIIEALTRGQ